MPIALVAVVVAVTACGGDSEPDDPTTDASPAATDVDVAAEGAALTLDQATVLANTLYADYQSQGAAFMLTIPTDEATITGSGVVDWVNHVGHVMFDPESAAVIGAEEAYWNADGVITPSGPLADPTTTWSFAPATMDAPFDRSVAIIAALASAAQDNPVLLQQGDARWLGEEEVGGELLKVFKNGGLLLWVEPEGRIRRAEGYVDGLPGRVVIELHEFGPKTITLPTAS